MSFLNSINKQLGRIIFGDSESVSLEYRIFTLFNLLLFLIILFTSISNLFLNIPLIFEVGTFSFLAGIVLIHFFSRKKQNWRPFVIPTFIFYLIAIALLWIPGRGTTGGMQYSFYVVSIFSIIFFKKQLRFISHFIIIIAVLALFSIDLFKPEWFHQYTNRLSWFIDNTGGIIISLSLVALCIYLVFNEYQNAYSAKDILLREITREKALVEKVMDEKRTILRIVAHDIANALFVIEGTAKQCRTKETLSKDAITKYISRISFASDTIHEIIDSIRILEALESGKSGQDMMSINPTIVFSDAEKMFSEALKSKNIKINLSLQSSDSLTFMANPIIFGNQIFNNIVSNAIKFSYQDSVINISVFDRGDFIEIAVADTGIGIPKQLLEVIFRFDAKTSRSGTLNEKGTGFGMPVVKKFVESFCGRIEIESKSESESPDDHGTTVRLFMRKGNGNGN